MVTQFLAASLLAIASHSAEPSSQDAYRADLAAIRDTILTHHPGPVNEANPAFAEWLEEGYQRALARADEINDPLSHFYGLSAFVAGFRDGHLGLANALPNPNFGWPGFIAAWRNDEIVVLGGEADAPPAGAVIRTCDGRPVAEWIQVRVFDFMFNPDLPSDWYPAVTRAFLSRGNPLAPLPGECVFELDGQAQTLSLNWRETDAETFSVAFQAGGFGQPDEAGITAFAPNRYWVALPTFGPGGELAETMTAMWERMRDNPQTFRNAELVVFDLRGNGGGSSMWGDRFDTALFGGQPDQAPSGAYVDWRATQGNRDHIAEAADGFIREQFGEDSEAMAWARRIIAGLDEAIANGEPLWRQVDDTGEADQTALEPPANVSARVAVLTDGSCASACLDFMDRLMARPGVVHIGAPTSADTDYMEVRTITLPSEAARLTFAQKVYRGRSRGTGVYYTPDVSFDGLFWTSEALTAWVNGLYEAGQLDR